VLRIREALLPMLSAEADVHTCVLRPELARHGTHLLGWADLTATPSGPLFRDQHQEGTFPARMGRIAAPISLFRDGQHLGEEDAVALRALRDEAAERGPASSWRSFG
jgi:hypothetical protein